VEFGKYGGHGAGDAAGAADHEQAGARVQVTAVLGVGICRCQEQEGGVGSRAPLHRAHGRWIRRGCGGRCGTTSKGVVGAGGTSLARCSNRRLLLGNCLTFMAELEADGVLHIDINHFLLGSHDMLEVE
jgi:hypothetical protein